MFVFMDLAPHRQSVARALNVLEASLARLVAALAHEGVSVQMEPDPSGIDEIRRAGEAYSAIDYRMEDRAGESVTCLGVIGVGECVVHEGRAVPGPYGAVICFSGRGPGEVFRGEAKIMGLSQWRSREGALFQTCAYTHWEATPLVNLLDLDEGSRAAWSVELSGSAVGIEDLLGSGSWAGTGVAMAALARNLLSTFHHWGSVGPPGDG